MDVTVVVTGHREGILARRTLKAAQQSIQVARDAGIGVELVGSLDRSDAETLAVFTEFCDRLVLADVGDLGLNRNAAVATSDAEFVCFCDADDLFGTTWVRDAYLAAKDLGPAVLHPQMCVLFGDVDSIYLREHVSSTSQRFDHNVLTQYNVWSALAFGRRQVFIDTPYVPARQGCGYEDWQFNLDTLAKGLSHVAVPNTLHWIRVKAQSSLCRQLRAANTALAPTDWYRRPRGPRAAIKSGPVFDHDWLRAETLAANATDPQCWVERPYRFQVNSEARAADAIWSAMKAPRGAAVIVTPSLARGGVTNVVRNAVRFYERRRQAVVVIVTDDRAEPLPGATVLAPFSESELSIDEQAFALQTILVQLQPVAIHAANSGLAQGVIRLNPACLRRTAKLYVWSFGQEISTAGRRSAPAFWHLPHIWQDCESIITDSRYWADHLRDTYGFPAELLRVCRQPVVLDGRNTNFDFRPLTVLWAGRLSAEKGVDFLADVVTACKPHGIRFIVAGSGPLEAEVRKLDVEYHGAYPDFRCLPDAQIFLMTSSAEGAAQVLLEAQARNLVPVVPAVGGLPEICYGGFVVPRTVKDFVTVLGDAAAGFLDLEGEARRGREGVANNHYWALFESDFASALGA